MAPPGQTANELMIYIHSTVEIDIDIELTKAKIKLNKDKITTLLLLTVVLLRVLRFLPSIPPLGSGMPLMI